jgi:fused signal recognition particle receptor
VQRQTAIVAAEQAAIALEQWIDAGCLQLPSLSATEQHAVFAQRLDHLRRLAALQRSEAVQWQLLQAQDDALLARFRRIADVLLPAWKQAALARQAQDQAQRNQQAAQLQAQIAAEVASAQARLR